MLPRPDWARSGGGHGYVGGIGNVGAGLEQFVTDTPANHGQNQKLNDDLETVRAGRGITRRQRNPCRSDHRTGGLLDAGKSTLSTG